MAFVEYHLATVGNQCSSLTNVVPGTNTIAHSDFVRQAIFAKLASRTLPANIRRN